MKALREALQMRQADLAYLCDISPSYLSEIERGSNRRNPSSAVLSRMADALKTSTDYLLGRTDDPSPPSAKLTGEEVTAAHASPVPPGIDLAEWERKARQRLEEFIAEMRREWEEERRRRHPS